MTHEDKETLISDLAAEYRAAFRSGAMTELLRDLIFQTAPTHEIAELHIQYISTLLGRSRMQRLADAVNFFQALLEQGLERDAALKATVNAFPGMPASSIKRECKSTSGNVQRLRNLSGIELTKSLPS